MLPSAYTPMHPCPHPHAGARAGTKLATRARIMRAGTPAQGRRRRHAGAYAGAGAHGNAGRGAGTHGARSRSHGARRHAHGDARTGADLSLFSPAGRPGCCRIGDRQAGRHGLQFISWCSGRHLAGKAGREGSRVYPIDNPAG